MLIDLIMGILLIVAIVKGIRRGFIVALFSMIGFIVGLVAALKLSTVVAEYLEGTVNVSAKWLPFIAFVLVFIAVALVVRLIAAAIEKMVELAMMGWINKIAGIILYVFMYTVIFSVILFYLVQLRFVSQESLDGSVTYGYIEPVGPVVIDGIGAVLPWFRDMFEELKNFFGTISDKIPPPKDNPKVL
ncbi:MAG: CvpA family protein [Chitinophagaceae bacterium]|nr:MAG: CvpA family protein [Chitinophagaceae bacterium]